MLFFMFGDPRIINGLLELLFLAKVELCIISQIIQRLYRYYFVLACLAAVQKLVDLVDQLLVLRIDHLIACYQTLVKFCSHE